VVVATVPAVKVRIWVLAALALALVMTSCIDQLVCCTPMTGLTYLAAGRFDLQSPLCG
jgi:hypothetical protein